MRNAEYPQRDWESGNGSGLPGQPGGKTWQMQKGRIQWMQVRMFCKGKYGIVHTEGAGCLAQRVYDNLYSADGFGKRGFKHMKNLYSF